MLSVLFADYYPRPQQYNVPQVAPPAKSLSFDEASHPSPVFDKDEILTATLDLDLVAKAKMDFDVIGHYSRPDVFRTEVNGMPGRVKDEGA